MLIRMLGLGAVMLSAVLLIAALVGGMTGESPKSGTGLDHAASASVEFSEISGAGGPRGHEGGQDEHSRDDRADHQGNR